MEIKEYFKEAELKKAKELINEFHGRMLLDTLVKNPSAAILSIYMACNKSKQPLSEKSAARELFISLGRKSEEFDKALYEISGKRKGKKGKDKLVDIDKDRIGLNFNGLKKVKDILRGGEDD